MSRLRLAAEVIGGALVFCLGTLGVMAGIAALGIVLGAAP